MRKVRVLIVGPPALSQLIRHLFSGEPEFEILGSPRGIEGLTRQVARQRPELIVANVKPVGAGLCATALSLKQFSPFSKLILICSVGDLTVSPCKSGADACLDQEKIVTQLLPTAWTLSAPALKIPFRSSASHPNKKDL